MTPSRHVSNRILTCFALCLAVGCATDSPDYRGLGLVDVTGTVQLDGQPLTGAAVMFEHADRTFSFGQTDAQGRYRLMFNTRQRGVLPGPKTVRISMTGPSEEESDLEGQADPPSVKRPLLSIPECYNSESQLTVVVGASDRVFHFHLKSGGAPQSREGGRSSSASRPLR